MTTKPNEKSPVEAPTSTEANEHLPSNSDKETTTLKTQLEAFQKEARIADSTTNDDGAESCFDRAWGANAEHAPIWADRMTSTGMVSDFIETPAELYPAAHRKNTGTLRTYLYQSSTRRFPVINVDIFQDGINQKARNRTGAHTPALRLFPWEIDQLIAALEASRDLAQAYIQTTENALKASGAFAQLEDE